MSRTILLYFHTLRYLTLRQLCYRLLRSVRSAATAARLRAGKRRAGATRGAGEPDAGSDGQAALSLLPWPDPQAVLLSDRLEILGTAVPLPELLGSRGGAYDDLLRYQLASQSYVASRGSDRSVCRRAMIESAKALLGAGVRRPLLALPAPHPTALRLVSWVRVLCGGTALHGLSASELSLLSQAVAKQLAYLRRRIEYETDGNHLIDNAAGLLYGGAWLLDGRSSADNGRERAGQERAARKAVRRGWELLRRELPRQLLGDGAHEERSSMYHLLVFERLLDVLNLLRNDALKEELAAAGTVREVTQAVSALRRRARRMRAWAQAVSWRDGTLAPVNDAIAALAPPLSALLEYADRQQIAAADPRRHTAPGRASARRPEEHSGMQRFDCGELECLFDGGAVGPDRVPGHAHADTLELLLRYRGSDILVDSGTSRYEQGAVRDEERSTAAHNTVVYGGRSSSEVWAAFRVARRAHPVAAVPASARSSAVEASDAGGEWWLLKAAGAHDGYARYGVIHERAIYVREAANGNTAARQSELFLADELHPCRRGLLPGRPARVLTAVAYFIIAPALAETVGAVRPATAGAWEVRVGPLLFRFTASGGAPAAAGFKPRIEPSQVAAGYRKRADTVRIAAPFRGRLETHIYEA